MLHGNVGITGSRIKRVTFYIPAVICKEGAKVNDLYDCTCLLLLNTKSLIGLAAQATLQPTVHSL